MGQGLLQRLLATVGQVRGREGRSALLMFSYSFLAMMTWNVVKPVTRSKFISHLGADNLPYVQLAAGLLVGILMAGYAWLVSRLPRRWCIPIVQMGIAGLLLVFYFLFRTGEEWVSVAFYLYGNTLLGILLISQFWTVANVVYDPRQAKRLFGFIGGGASLGGIAGSFVTDQLARPLGTNNLVLIAAVIMVLCVIVVVLVVSREEIAGDAMIAATEQEKGVGAKRAIELLRQSKHLQMIALVISFAAIGAAIIEQQFNMALAASYGPDETNAITAILARVQFWASVAGFGIQILLTSRIHRYLGIGFALLLLPFSLGTTAAIMLFNAAIWAPALARALDTSLRYTVDKTTREILYMPLPAEIKFEAKPFVDVTVDRFAKGLGAVLLLFLIKPWGLALSWQQVSYVSISITAVWIFVASRAKRGYLAAFRHSIETQEMKPAEVRLAAADLSTIETLLQELASPDERRVVYAIDVLEALDRRHLITPLLLHHESPAVRARALNLIGSIPADAAARWLPAIQRMLGDQIPEVRAAAVGALASIRDEKVTDLVRPLLQDKDARIVMMAAMILATSPLDGDTGAAEKVLTELVSDPRETATDVRRDFAIAIRHIPNARFRRLLIPLLHDSHAPVAEEAMRSVRQLGTADLIFVPTLISLLRDRRLKSSAREVLVGYGEPVLPILAHFLNDPEEDIWVRRHIPATVALIPCQKAADILIDALEQQDGFLRFKIITALEKLRRTHPRLDLRPEPIEAYALKECDRYNHYQAIAACFPPGDGFQEETLAARALNEKMKRALDRVYKLLGLLYPWRDIAAARLVIEQKGSRGRAAALEYLDNMLKGELRRRMLLALEGTAPDGEAGAPAPAVKERPKSLEDAVLRLIHDEDQILSTAAIYFVWQRRLSTLQGELEQVLATRNVKDWWVFEAASWVHAALRLPEGTLRELWVEPLPTVEVVNRMRRLPLFASVTIDELFRIARAGRQVRHEPDRVLYHEGRRPENFLFLLDGQVSFRNLAGRSWDIEAPATVAFGEVLQEKPMSATIRTTAKCVSLALHGQRYRTMLADNTELVQGLFRLLCDGTSMPTERVVDRGAPDAPSIAPVTGSLKPIDKVLALGTIPLFSGIAAEDMLSLASIAEEVRLVPDSVLFRETDPPALHVLLSGELSLESPQDQPAVVVGPRDAIGIRETFARVPLSLRARVIRAGTALRIDQEDLFDLLGQRSSLLQQLFGALFRSQWHSGTAPPAEHRIERQATDP
jgi:AAA family ATP:ADP antiporter